MLLLNFIQKCSFLFLLNYISPKSTYFILLKQGQVYLWGDLEPLLPSMVKNHRIPCQGIQKANTTFKLLDKKAPKTSMAPILQQ